MGSHWYPKVSLPVTMSQTRSDCLRQLFEVCEGTNPPYPYSVPRSTGGAPNGHNASRHPCDDGGSDSSFPMKDISFFCNSWVFFDQTLHLHHNIIICSLSPFPDRHHHLDLLLSLGSLTSPAIITSSSTSPAISRPSYIPCHHQQNVLPLLSDVHPAANH